MEFFIFGGTKDRMIMNGEGVSKYLFMSNLILAVNAAHTQVGVKLGSNGGQVMVFDLCFIINS